MATQLITIQEAAKLSQKSTQTIRRLIKMNKLKCKRKRTPQGFNYEVQKDSLMKYLGTEFEEEIKINGKNSIENDVFELAVEPDIIRAKRRKKSAIYDVEIPTETGGAEIKEDIFAGINIEETVDVTEVESEVVTENTSASKEALQFAAILQQMLKQHQEDKDRLFALVEQFQKRTLVLEERVRRLEAPKRNWWKLW